MSSSKDVFSRGLVNRSRRPLLSRYRKPIFGWLQLAVLILLILEPLRTTRAVYVPDNYGNPYWFPLNASDTAPSNGPDWSDDGSGNPQWRDQYQAAVDAGQIAWWGGGNFLVDGAWVNYPAQYHLAGYGDSDG